MMEYVFGTAITSEEKFLRLREPSTFAKLVDRGCVAAGEPLLGPRAPQHATPDCEPYQLRTISRPCTVRKVLR